MVKGIYFHSCLANISWHLKGRELTTHCKALISRLLWAYEFENLGKTVSLAVHKPTLRNKIRNCLPSMLITASK